MKASSAKLPAESTAVAVHGDSIHIDGFIVEDSTLASLLRREPEDQWPAVVARALGWAHADSPPWAWGWISTKSITAWRGAFADLTDEAQNHVSRILDVGQARVSGRNSIPRSDRRSWPALSRSSSGGRGNSCTPWTHPRRQPHRPPRGVARRTRGTRRAARIQGDGDVRPGVGHVGARVAHRPGRRTVRGNARSLDEAEGAAVESERGTQKGFAYEDRVEEALRLAATRLPGAYVERT